MCLKHLDTPQQSAGRECNCDTCTPSYPISVDEQVTASRRAFSNQCGLRALSRMPAQT